ncbi:MAG: RNA-binding S4 domain-containing protein [Symbiobacteriaceae bacterium]|nr:RNA-binding S4 domain-containing protein [Symbiobacteriaceae bacterium]
MRLDKYLKVSRLIKRRTLAKEVAAAERIEINGRTAKPASEVKPGDRITLHYGSRSQTVEVLSIEERVAKVNAAQLYRVLADSSKEGNAKPNVGDEAESRKA